MSSTIGFFGGVGSVTGANFLLDTGGAKFAVDCGLEQGDRFAAQTNEAPFPYDPASVQGLFVTHAHADHIGRIPKLVRDGFAGTIYSTPPTKDLAAIMLRDAYKIMRYEASAYGTEPLYDETDIDAALGLWDTHAYGEEIRLEDRVTAVFTNAGHILGSAMVRFSREGHSVVFTGDIGNVPQPLLDAPEVPKEYQYLVMESVYGDRLHEGVAGRTSLLKRHIEATQRNGGTLIIPAFSIERTQSMLYEINNLVESGDIPPIDTFLDSPLAIAVTEVYRKYASYLSTGVREAISSGDDIFSFPKLTISRTAADSREIAEHKGAKIIIAGSGMSHGGRIIGHEKRYLEDPHTTLLLVGYQAVGSMGRRLADGAKRIQLEGDTVRVRAKVARITGYSGHADRDQLIEFVAQGGDSAKQVFVAMGEERSSLFLVQRLCDYLGLDAVAPTAGEVVEIEF